MEEEINQCFILPNFSEWGQFGIMKVGNIVPYSYSIITVIKIFTFNIGFLEKKISEKSKIINLVNLHLRLISYSTV